MHPDEELLGSQHDKWPSRTNRRRWAIASGVTGLALLVAGGTLAAHSAGEGNGPHERETATPSQEAAMSAASPLASPVPEPVASANAAQTVPHGTPRSGGAEVDPSLTLAPQPSTTPEILASLRARVSRAATDGSQVRRPLPNDPFRVPPSALHKEAVGSLREEGWYMRIVSARTDLTGQRELAWVADAGRQVGRARCTQKITLSPNVPPQVRPTLLLCWRLSARKSVYTVLVDNRGGTPSHSMSAAAIDRAWQKLD